MESGLVSKWSSLSEFTELIVMKAILLTVAGTGFLCWSTGPAPFNQILLRNLDSADGYAEQIVADASGHLFVVSALSTKSGGTRIVELDLNGSKLASMDIAELYTATAAATDAQGNLVLAGSHSANLDPGMFLKVDPRSGTVLFSKPLPGWIGAIALDASDNIFLTGGTSSADFPISPGAYLTKPPVTDAFGTSTFSFLTEVSPDGEVLYSTYFGAEGTNCAGGSSCIGSEHSITLGTSIVVTASGGVIIAGSTNASGLPTTPGAPSRTCQCGFKLATAGFVARFQPAAAEQLAWSTFLNAVNMPGFSVNINSLDIDAAENVMVGGSARLGLPTTAGTIRPTLPDIESPRGFLMKLSRADSAVIWGTYIDGVAGSVNALHLDPQGRVLFTASALLVSTLPLQKRVSYVARLSSDGAELYDYYEGPVGKGLAITSTEGFAAMGAAIWIETANPGPSLLSVTNSASEVYASSVRPVELVTLRGVGIGPQTPTSGEVQNGVFTSSLAGFQVLFDGVAVPLLYADSGQINAVVPQSVAGSTHLQVSTPAGLVDGPAVPVSDQTPPGIFRDSDTGLAIALNEDGSTNSPSNPATAGSVVSVYVTGVGSAHVFRDGTVVPDGIYSWSRPVWAVTDNRSLEVDFAGDAPGMVAGVVQVKFRLPDPLPAEKLFKFSLLFGGTSANSLTAGPSFVAVPE